MKEIFYTPFHPIPGLFFLARSWFLGLSSALSRMEASAWADLCPTLLRPFHRSCTPQRFAPVYLHDLARTSRNKTVVPLPLSTSLFAKTTPRGSIRVSLMSPQEGALPLLDGVLLSCNVPSACRIL